MHNTNDYIILEDYPDGSSLIMSLNDVPDGEMHRQEDYLYEKSVMEIDKDAEWHVPTKEEFDVLMRLLKEKQIDFDTLNFQPHSIYDIYGSGDGFHSDSKSLKPYCDFQRDEDGDKEEWAVRPFAIARLKQANPDEKMTLKRLVVQYGRPIPLFQIQKFLLTTHMELDKMHEQNICHNDICPDNIIVEITSNDVIRFQLQSSLYSAKPAKGDAVLNQDNSHRCFWAPENYIGETSFYSDQYQLAMTVYFAIYGHLPPNYKRANARNIASAFDSRNFLPKDFENNAFGRSLVKALRLNPIERFRCMDEWSIYILDEFVAFNAYSDFYAVKNTMSSSGHLYISGDHYQTYLNIFGAKSCTPNAHIMETYKEMGIHIWECHDFRCYERRKIDINDNLTYVYFPNGRCKNMFRLMIASLAVKEYIGNRYLYSYSDKCHAINEITKASKDIRGFSIDGVTFLSYEKLIDETTDFKRLINDAHTALQKVEATMKHLLEGGSLEEEGKREDWVSVPIFYLNNENVSYLRTIIHYTNIISPFSRCVTRGNTVCIEGSQKHINEGVEIFEFIKNYSYQNS